MQYWILQHNPRLLPIDVPNPPGVPGNRDYWHISRYEDEVDIGDVAFIWHAGTSRGIYDITKILSVPPHKREADDQIELLRKNDNPYWADVHERERLRRLPTVLIERQYPRGLKRPVLVEELREHGFGNLPIIRMAQRGIFRVEQGVGSRLLEYIRRTRG
jgi:hypothetical protein